LPNPRTPIADLDLTGSPNLLRARKRMVADAARPPLSREAKSELVQINALIQLAIKGRRHGQSFKGKRNPAYANLEALMRIRRLLQGSSGSSETQKSTDEILAEADALMEGIN
jgi:hypothetical protein